MRVSVSPARLDVTPGVPSQLEITITNLGTIIGGYSVRLLGVDPSWVDLSEDQISLFPDESRSFTAFLTIPVGLIAGERRMAVQLREETPPSRTAVEEVVLVVPAAPNLQVRVDPVVVTSGKKGRFSLLVDNTGNTPLVGHLLGDDSEAKLAYEFDPPTIDLAPGEHQVIDLQVKGRRPTFGTPLVRLINLHVRDGAPPPPVSAQRDLSLGRKKKKSPAQPAAPEAASDVPPVGNATFIQKARLARGALSLVGLLVAITVFAIVIVVSLSRFAGQSAQDRDLALKIAAAQESGATATGTAGIAGKVVTATDTTKPAKAVEISLYSADDLTDPLSKAVSNGQGAYTFGKLAAGDYKLYYQGAGLQKQWYPQALLPDDAAAVTVEPGVVASVADVPLGGTPASIEGKVVGADVTDATLTLRSLIVVDNGGGNYDAEVQSVAVAPDGSFALGNVPSPSTYNIEVAKQGYATSTQQVEVKPGEAVTGIRVALVAGNGAIEGSVVSNNGKVIENATVTLASDSSSIATVTDAKGDYDLQHLPTPAVYTMTVTKDGFTTQTLTLTLGDAQSLTGVAVAMVDASGTLAGHTLVATEDGERPAGGVTVSVSDGERVVETASTSPISGRSGSDAAAVPPDVGSWTVSGLTLPGIYNVTFSRADLTSQTISISLGVSGSIDSGSLGVTVDDGGIRSVLRASTAEITGLVTQAGTADPDTGVFPGVGEVEVTLTSGSTIYRVITATAAPNAGIYHISGVVPGTYTATFTRSGVRSESAIVTLVAGTISTYDPVLDPGAQFSVRLVDSDGVTLSGRYYVALYRASDYPSVLYREDADDTDGYVFTGVDAPESYIVQVSRSRSSAALASKRVTILANGDVEGNQGGNQVKVMISDE